jgi:Holliday junction resolvase-like predicted endonuclease
LIMASAPTDIPAQAPRPGDQLRLSGAAAERRARWHLWRRGWHIVACNWVGGGGELDIVASRWRTLLVVEVRRRADDQPLASVDRAKLDRTLAASRALIIAHELQRYRLRIDLIGFDGAGKLIRRRDILRQGQPGY